MYDYSSQRLDNGRFSFLKQSNTMLNNRYRILKPLGQGGFGKTFLAIEHKQQLQTKNGSVLKYSKPHFCVIKQFFPEHHNVDHYLKASELFRQESLLLKELGKHPQIPELLDFFEEDGQQYLVQEWIDGQTLEQELAEAGSFNEDEICQLLEMVLTVLQFVHDHQVIHRDIKPANIIRRRSDLQLALVDFGSAKYSPSATCLWQQASLIAPTTGTLIGSAEYAAPEQIKGKAVFASDLYSLGVTCLHLLTQIPPFDLYDCGEDIWTWRSYLTKPINPSLEQIICKLLQKPIKRRYQSATEVLSDLNSFSKQKFYIIPAEPIARTLNDDDDDFETPYFGLNSKENIPASMTVYSTALNIYSIAAVTVFDPQTQAWYRIPPKMEANKVVQKASVFLDSCLAMVGSPAQDHTSSSTGIYGILKQGKARWRTLFAIIASSLVCFTVVCLVLDMKPHQQLPVRKNRTL